MYRRPLIAAAVSFMGVLAAKNTTSTFEPAAVPGLVELEVDNSDRMVFTNAKDVVVSQLFGGYERKDGKTTLFGLTSEGGIAMVEVLEPSARFGVLRYTMPTADSDRAVSMGLSMMQNHTTADVAAQETGVEIWTLGPNGKTVKLHNIGEDYQLQRLVGIERETTSKCMQPRVHTRMVAESLPIKVRRGTPQFASLYSELPLEERFCSEQLFFSSTMCHSYGDAASCGAVIAQGRSVFHLSLDADEDKFKWSPRGEEIVAATHANAAHDFPLVPVWRRDGSLVSYAQEIVNGAVVGLSRPIDVNLEESLTPALYEGTFQSPNVHVVEPAATPLLLPLLGEAALRITPVAHTAGEPYTLNLTFQCLLGNTAKIALSFNKSEITAEVEGNAVLEPNRKAFIKNAADVPAKAFISLNKGVLEVFALNFYASWKLHFVISTHFYRAIVDASTQSVVRMY